ncbi:hypothetical protein QF030_006047 [Streptomyces rishiriensis]|uniref:Secreted protein n=1 Tax=Streptomyces rishiriensis TaxID=68264 RepID=A0ABU0NXM6_STRRH|nr:hypothetical protein [Streptomyces rishiriensis]
MRTEALAVLLLAVALGRALSLAVLTAFSVGRTGRAAPAVIPLGYATVVPGRVALRVRAGATVATARE